MTDGKLDTSDWVVWRDASTTRRTTARALGEQPATDEASPGPLTVAPVSTPSAQEVLAELEARSATPTADEPAPPPATQFTLAEMFQFMTAIAVGLALLKWIPVQFTFLLGVLILTGLSLSTNVEVENRAIRRAGWALCILYFMFVIASLFTT